MNRTVRKTFLCRYATLYNISCKPPILLAPNFGHTTLYRTKTPLRNAGYCGARSTMWGRFVAICGQMERNGGITLSETLGGADSQVPFCAYNKRKTSHELAERISVAATLRLPPLK